MAIRNINCLITVFLLVLIMPDSARLQGDTGTATEPSGLVLPSMPPFDITAIDQLLDPCTDFYQYACGGWHAGNPMPPDESFWSRPFTQYSRQIDDYLKILIEQVAVADDQRTPDEQKVGDYYLACMDTATIESRGLDQLRQELALIDSMHSISELPAVLGNLHRNLPWFSQDGEPLLSLDTIVDSAKQQIALQIGPSGLGLPGPDYYTGTDHKSTQLLQQYVNHIAEVFRLIGEAETEARRHADAVIGLEQALASGYLAKSEMRNNPALTQNPMSKVELQALTPKFRWNDFFRAYGMPASGRVNPSDIGYLRNLDKLLTETALESWRAYLRWQIISERSKLLPAVVRNERFGFFGRTLLELIESPARDQECLDSVKISLPSVLGRLFVDRVFQSEMRDRAEDMFTKIQAVMRERIQQAEWMQADTKQEALAKVDATRLSVGHPDVWLDDRRLVIRPDDYYGNVRRAGEAQRRVSFERLGRPPDLNWWSVPVTWVGGYYRAAENAIVVTAAMMLHYENQAQDAAVLYGGLGVLLAHELIHGFDPSGRNFDATGEYRNWWAEQDAARFEQRGECVARQFSEFEYAPGIPIDGKFVVSEQFTEIAAHRIAWATYRKHATRQDEANVKGFSPLQRYLLTAAQTWCTEATDGNWRAMAAGLSSKAWAAPMVNGTILHLPEFREAFQCSDGQPMVKPIGEICPSW